MVIVQHPQGPNEEEPGKYGRTIDFGKRKDAGSGYLASSDRVGPGVLVLHEWFGLQPSFVRYADSLREEGFTVLAPDLYEGRLASNVEEAEALATGLDQERTGAMLKAAASYLVDNWHPRLGVVGFSLGGAWALQLAQDLDVEATVLYYGFGSVDPARLSGSILGHFGENDHFDSPDDVRSFMAGLEEGGADVDTRFYPGVGHWFANASVPDAYDEEAATQAREATIEFLRHHLS